MNNAHNMKLFTYIVFAAVLALLPAQLHAEERPALPTNSLFFTQQEAHEAERLANALTPTGTGDIRLGAVMFYGPDDWTLWLQGQLWTPETTRKDLRILHVSANEVRLTWRSEEKAAEQEITLKPNESFQITTGQVIANP